MSGRGQARNVIVDARGQPGMTKEFAQRGIDRALGADRLAGNKLESVTVKTSSGDVTYSR